LALAVAAATFTIDRYRHRFVRSNADLVAHLPDGDGNRFFVDVALLRHAGILDALSRGKLAEDPDYKRFEEETRFNYRRDLDGVAGLFDGDRVTFLLRGRFDRSELWKYAIARGGQCDRESCRMPGSSPGRWTSFALPQPDVLSLVAASSSLKQLPRLDDKGTGGASPSSHPVWLEVSQSVLRNAAALPLPLQILAVSLQSANPVILSAAAAVEGGAYVLNLDAQLPNRATAETIRKQLELETKSLSLALARQHHTPDPKDFTALLASGTFQVSDRHMLGKWIIRPELLHSLE
jgi:hypothetical protein